MMVVIHKLCRGSEDQVWSLYQNYPELMQAREKGTTDPTILGEKTYLVGLANMGCGIFGIWGVFPTFLSFKVKQIDVKCGTQAPLAQIGAGNTAQAPFWSSWWTLGNGKVNEIYQYPDAAVHGGWFSYNVVFQDDKNESQCLV